MSYRYSYVRGITNSIDKVEPINEVGGCPSLHVAPYEPPPSAKKIDAQQVGEAYHLSYPFF